jgi:thioredoxin-like negative regulator of GroEL
MSKAPSAPSDWQVICLCAAWCGVCREWDPVFQQLAREHPGVHFAWVDIEDEDQAMGDVEVETFPTVLIAQGDHPRFFGPVPPSAQQLARLLTRLQAQTQPHAPGSDPKTRSLLHRLQPVLPRAA